MKLRQWSALLVLGLLFAATTQLLAQPDDGSTFLPLISKQTVDSTPAADRNQPTNQSSVLSCDAAGPIAYTGHGVFFDANGQAIQVTPAFIKSAQQCYLDILLQQADEQQRALFEQKQQQVLGGQPWNLRSELYANAALLAWLNQAVKPADADRTARQLKLLQQTLTSPSFSLDPSVSSDDARPFALSAALKNLLMAEGLVGGGEDSISAASTELSGAAYINQCAQAGVPIPPDWGTNQWVNRGSLTIDFLGSTPDAEVYTYESDAPEGLCIALPRSAGNTIGLLGIICLGRASSNACFWDNQENDQQVPIPKGTIVPLADFAGGAELFEGSGGVCTDCHAGENPFVIHPDTNLGLPNLDGLDLRSDEWYKPLVHSAWPQNVGPTNLLDGVSSPKGMCTLCHTQTMGGGRFPEPSTATPGYCGAVLSQARTRTMPPGNPGDPNYASHVGALLAACSNPPAPPCNGSIYVDAAHSGTGSGKATSPLRTISAAYDYACPGAQLHIEGGAYPETLPLAKQITLLRTGGLVTIGD
jgi:hypothetical protein